MTVRELIEHLAQFDSDLTVVFETDDSILTDVSDIRFERIEEADSEDLVVIS